MRWFLPGLTLFVLALPAPAQPAAAHPILVLDSGGHTGRIWDVLFTSGGKEAITVSYDKTLRVWDLETGQTTRVLRPPIGPGPEGILICAALSPDGTTLAAGGMGVKGDENVIYLISLASGQITGRLRGHKGNPNALAFSPSGDRLASAANDRTARVWDLKTRACLHVLEGHDNDNVNGVAFSPDGRRVGTACADKTARLWSATTGESLRVLRHQGRVHWLAFSPDGAEVVTAVGYNLVFWGSDGKFRKEIELRDNAPHEVAYARYLSDGKRVLFAGVRSGVADRDTGRVHRFGGPDMVAANPSPDETRVVTADAAGGVYLWKLENGTPVRSLRGESRAVWAAGWSADGNAVAFGTQGQRLGKPNACFPLTRSFHLVDLELREAAAGDWRRARTAAGELALEPAGRTAVAVRSEGRQERTLRYRAPGFFHLEVESLTLLPPGRAALGGLAGEVVLFDLASGDVVRAFKGHVGEVWDLAPSPDGRYLLSASNDHTLRVWSPEQDEPLLSLFVAGNDWIAWTPEGYYAASPAGERLMGWHVNNGPDKMATFHPAAQFRKSLYRPDVVRRVLETGSVAKALKAADEESGKASRPVQVAEVLPPVVLITTPDQARTTATQPDLEVRALAQPVGGHPVTGLRLLVNGRPYAGPGGVKKYAPPKTDAVRESWKVTLAPGKTVLAVQAESPVSKALSEPVEVLLEGGRGIQRVEGKKKGPTEEDLPNLYVLAVGISEYPGPLKLNYAAKDAQTLAKTWQAAGKGLYRKVEVKVLTDKGATRRAILQGLTWLRKQMTQRDVGVLSFAGHGDKDHDGKFYLLPVDVDPDDLLSTAVPGDLVQSALATMPGRVIVLLDACHSGAVGGGRRSRAGLTDDLVRDLVSDDYGVIVLCSSMGREVSLEDPAVEHGLFTLAIVEGLGGKAADPEGVVYVHRLNGYVTDRVKELSKGRQHPVTSQPSTLRSFPLSRPRAEPSSRRGRAGPGEELTWPTTPSAPATSRR